MSRFKTILSLIITSNILKLNFILQAKRASVTTNPLLWYSRNISSSSTAERDIVNISSCIHTAKLIVYSHNNVIGMRGNFSSHLFWSFKHPADSSHINATPRTSDCLWLHKTYSNWFQLQPATSFFFARFIVMDERTDERRRKNVDKESCCRCDGKKDQQEILFALNFKRKRSISMHGIAAIVIEEPRNRRQETSNNSNNVKRN